MNNEVKNELYVLDEEIERQIRKNMPFYFAPSITRKRTIKGKTYIVRSYFMGDKDFAKAMESLAVKQAYKK